MSLDKNIASENNNGNRNMSTNSLFDLLGSQNLISSTNNLSEVNEIVKALEENIKALKKNTASEIQKLSLPSIVQNITGDISPNLPGITLSTLIGDTVYLMPVLFFKNGITEVTESIYLSGESVPRGIAKPATSFMDKTMLEKLKTQYSYRDGKQIGTVIILAATVINLENHIKNGEKTEDMVINIRNYILKEWSAGLINIVTLESAKQNRDLGTPFKEGQLFGKDNTAVARVEAVSNLTIDGVPVPYNLSVKVSTTNKNGTQNQNSNNTRSVASAFLTVSLEAMSNQAFIAARQRNPGAPVGPLVPVIATGTTVPGETLNGNNSIITTAMGLLAAIGANNISYFSEAFRGKTVGNRGNIANFNHYLGQILGASYGTNQILTDKNLTNAQVVHNWLNSYVAPNAVYVLDLPTFSGDVANADFFWNLVGRQSGSTYHRAFINVLDALSNGEFSKLVAFNQSLGKDRDRSKQWVVGDEILKATNIIIPNGIAQGTDGKWFALSEVDGMFLRQDKYYGQNEMAISQYQGLIGGSIGADALKVRQYNIYNSLVSLFNGNVIVDRWDRRFIWENSFFSTFAEAMGKAGVLSMTGSNSAAMFNLNSGNDYLNYAITANLSQAQQVANLGMANGFINHY